MVAFVLEAAVMVLFKIKKFGAAFGISIIVNLISLALLYFLAGRFLSALGYDIGKPNGLNTQFQVVAFLWWFCTVAEGLLLSLFLRRQPREKIFLASALMNLASFVFLYLFDIISH